MLYENRNKKIDSIIISLIIIFVCGFFTITYINKNGFYPLGKNTFEHLFKAEILYNAIKEKKFFLNYSEVWYNGFQPFRYTPPLTYYFLAFLNFFSDNIIFTYNAVIFLVFIIGAIGWLINGIYINNIWISLIIGILWFFVPNNLRVIFLEGNIPNLLVNTILPYILLFLHKALKESKVSNFIILSILLTITTLISTTSSLTILISFFVFLLAESILNKTFFKNLIILLYSVLGILMASFWLYPAFKGKLLLRDGADMVVENQLFKISSSLNPLLRLKDKEVFYFGLSFLLLALFGILFKNKEDKSGFYVGGVLFLGISNVVLSFLKIININEQLLITSLTSIAIVFILYSFLNYICLRKVLIIFWILILATDCFISAKGLISSVTFPDDIAKELDKGLLVASERIALLDNKTFGSFPSYYLKFNPIDNKIMQVYGWDKESEDNNKNIIRLNNALERNYFNYLFDRSLELGADTLIIKKSLIENFQRLNIVAKEIGYQIVDEGKETITLKLPIDYSFGTSNEYKGIAIGKYAESITYIFPSLYLGDSEFIDDYKLEDLKSQRVVFFSGYKYRNKNKAEELLLNLSRSNVRVVVDTIGIKESTLFDIIPQEIVVKDSFKEFYYKNENISLNQFPREESQWKTNFFNVSDDENYAVIDSKVISYILKKDNENLSFLALNIPYYSYLTKEENCIEILEDLMGLKAFETPKRTINKVNTRYKENNIFIDSGNKNTILPIAYNDYLIKNIGEFETVNDLVVMHENSGVLKIIYPGISEGVIISIVSIIVLATLSSILVVKGKRNE